MCGQRTDDQEHVGGGQNIEAYAGDELDVVLADRPGAGYEWVPRPVPAGLVLVGTDWAGPEPSQPGASRPRTFRFAARQPGSYRLAFDLVRPWEPPDVPPAQQHTVTVVVWPPPTA